MSSTVYVMDPPAGQQRGTGETLGNQITGAAIACTIIAIIAVALRLFTKIWTLRKRPGADDVFVVVSLCASIAFMGLSIRLVSLGAGKHMWDVVYDDYSPWMLVTLMGVTISYSFSVSCAKLSILFFYLRLSPDRNFRISVYVLVALTTAYTVIYNIVIFLLCDPPDKAWFPAKDGHCTSQMGPMMTLSIANIVIDSSILIIPIRIVAPLQMPRRQKLSVVLVFATGGFVIASAIYRTIILPKLLTDVDYTWNDAGQNVWGSIEVNAGIVCACAPTLKPFFVRYIPILGFTSRNHSSGNGKTSSTCYGPFSTTIERNRRRRNGDMVARGFELTSKIAGPNGSALSLSNDEIALWTQTGKPAPAATGAAGSEDLVAPWREHSDDEHRRDKSGWGRDINIAATDYDEGSHKVCNGGIMVDHETTVTYGTHK